jgi:hypothetical protein
MGSNKDLVAPANGRHASTMRQPLPSNATEYRLSTLPRHHSCPFCAASTNVDAGAAIHSLARSVASCALFVLSSTRDFPSLLRRACRSLTPVPTRSPRPQLLSHSPRRKASNNRLRNHNTAIVVLHIRSQPVGHASSAVTAVQALRISNTRRSTHTTLVSCHAHGTLVAYRTPTFLDKTPSPATAAILHLLNKTIAPVALSLAR